MRRFGQLIALLLAAWSCAVQPALACRTQVVLPWLNSAHDAVVLVEVTEAQPVEARGFWAWDVTARPVRTINGTERSGLVHFRAVTGSNGCPRTPPAGSWVAYLEPNGTVEALSLEDALLHDARLSLARGR